MLTYGVSHPMPYQRDDANILARHFGLAFGNGDALGALVAWQWTPCTSSPCASNTSRSVLMLALQASYEGNISAVSGG
jgi:hypothetical protein